MPELFEEAARFARETAAARLPPAEDDALRRAVLARVPDAAGRRPLWIWGGSLAVAAAAVALVVIAPESVPPDIDVREGGACLEATALSLRARPGCADEPVVALDGVELRLASASEVRRDPDRLTVSRGRVGFRAAHRPPGKTLRIQVSHGVIVVIGTVFTVAQEALGGSVRVDEGSIAFEWSDGSPTEPVTAGQTLVWPRLPAPPATAPATTAESPRERDGQTPPARDEEIDDARAVMQRLFQLKSQRRWDEAIRLLEGAVARRDLSPAQRERLSFELGNLLVEQRGPVAACRHWRQHLRRFPSGPHAAEIDALLLSHCPLIEQ